MTVEEFIRNDWDNCIVESKEDNGELIGLPYPYTVPAVGQFDEIYYWDTYFINLGLELCGRYEQMKFNTDNLLYLADRFGFVPNGNKTYYLKQSQPPFLSEMVRDVYKHYHDKSWLEKAYAALQKEYDFWMTKRLAPCGLNQYRPICPAEDVNIIADILIKRIGYVPELSEQETADEALSLFESGWDLNPRCGLNSKDFVQVELNSLLYLLEKNMEFFAAELGKSDGSLWSERAEKRKELMNKFMTDENNLFYDYNYKTGELSRIYSNASYYPLFGGLANDEQAAAAVENLPKVEKGYGLAACEKNDVKGVFQWSYPNGWPCMQYLVAEALRKYGYTEDAKRLARKYIELTDRVFAETGKLWEKYNVVDGNIDVVAAYPMHPMLGWTAGAYMALKEFIL